MRAAILLSGRVQKNQLFVCGVARSGTTALAQVLNAHPQVIVGLERFKGLVREEGIEHYNADLFEKTRFFDFSDGLTNLTADSPHIAARYRDFAAKFDQARYVGDKVPEMFRFLPQICAQFPAARFVIILRDVAQVAYSWQVKAADPRAGWHDTHDAARAVPVWNRGIKNFWRHMRTEAHRTALVEYDSFFGDPIGARLKALCDFLELPLTPEAQAGFDEAAELYRSHISKKDRALSPDKAELIESYANRRTFDALRAMAI